MDKIAILDYGSQYTHLIATRIRRMGVYSEILDPSTPAIVLQGYKGIILSGGPASVYEPDSPKVDPKVFELGLPILGICYGHQLMTQLLGGRVEPGKGLGAEFGKAKIRVKKSAGLFKCFISEEQNPHAPELVVWMSHGDKVTKLPEGFEILASSDDDPYSAIGDLKRNFFGIQFHAEVAHTLMGSQILKNFVDLCEAKAEWNLDDFISDALAKIREQAGDRNVFMLVSGGVDSTVAFVLLAKALGPERVYGLFVDTGFMRLNEAEEVSKSLSTLNIPNLHVYDARADFFAALKDVIDPEKKREIIGRLFLEVQKKAIADLHLDPEHWLLGQGTIYPDTIESGGTRHSAKIKTHHNRVPEVEALIEAGKIIEPLKDLYKDEVREVGLKLGLSDELVWRHPFPGPGLAVRILCTKKENWAENHEDLDARIQKFLDDSEHSELHAKTLPIQSVGVQGDFRTYRHPVLLSGPSNWEALSQLSPALTNRFSEINRVLYLVSSAQPSEQNEILVPNLPIQNISIKKSTLTEDRVKILQWADHEVTAWLHEINHYRTVWQMPVVLVALSIGASGESIVLRPIESEEAMTAHFAALPMDEVQKLAQKLLTLGRNPISTNMPSISAILYDVTNKPPGTIEWE